jgi:hypothetical protein
VLADWGRSLTVLSFSVIWKSSQIKDLGLNNDQSILTRNEYILWLLVQLGKVDMQDIKHCGQAFDLVDSEHSGRLDLGKVHESEHVNPPIQIRRGVTTAYIGRV